MTIGIDIGGTKIAAGRISPKGKISGFVKIPTEASKGKTRVLANIKKSIHLVMSENITAIGIGIAGQVDMKNGVFLGGPNLPKAFKNINLKKILEKEFGIPVVIDNDVHCILLAEAELGVARGKKSAVAVALGTGIGGAIVKNGKILHGEQNTAGEIGHMEVGGNAICTCKKHGHVEAYAGGRAMSLRYKKLTKKSIDLRELENLYKKGGVVAVKIIDEASSALATGLTNILVMVNPECLVLGGGLANFKEYIKLTQKKMVPILPFKRLQKTPILHAKLGRDAGLIGAGLLAMNEIR